MPRIVDHEERRRSIIEATWRVIAREGLANVTTREIAREAGCSSGVLSHYFASKADILTSCLVAAHRGVRGRTDERIAGQAGMSALRTMLLESLPLDEQRLLEAKIEVSFWGQAVGDPELTAIQNREVDGLWVRLRQRVDEANDAGELRLGLAPETVVNGLVALIDSLSLRAVLYPERGGNDDQLTLLDAFLAQVAAPGHAPG